MSERPGFMMYHDTFHALDGLDDASFRRVMRAACEYSETGSVATELGAIEQVVFGILRCKLDADLERYQRRVEAGRKGGMAKASNAKQSLANSSKGYQNVADASNAKQSLANLPTTTITPTPTITTDTTITTGYSSNTCAREDKEEEFPPSVGEVEEYIREHGLGVDAQDFMERCEAAGWKDGKGEPVTNWRMWLKGYAIRTARPEGSRASRLGTDPRLAALEAMKGGVS